jgi:hypothetical protein
MNRTPQPVATIPASALRLPQGSGLRLDRFPEAAAAQALEAHAETLRRGGERVLKRDHRSRITAAVVDGQAVVIKEVVKGGAGRHLADGFRGSPARRAWCGGHGLLARGIGACTPLAFLETRRRGLPVASTAILEDLRPAVPSTQYAARGTVEAGAVLDALCQLAIALHRNRVVYGDLRAQHIFVRDADDPEPAQLEVALIDLEGVRFARHLSQALRIQSLAELNASLADDLLSTEVRRRAFEVYCRTLPFAGGSPRALAEIVRRSLARHHLWSGAGCHGGHP